MVAAIDPPMTMRAACSLMNMWRSPPIRIITETTMMPHTSPTPVMMSIGFSNAYANDRPSWTVARPNGSCRQLEPTSVPLKYASPNIVRYNKLVNKELGAGQGAVFVGFLLPVA